MNRLRNEIGTRVDHDGVPWVAVEAHERGAAVTGPPTALVPGRWEVTFAASVSDDVAADRPVCRIAVQTLEGTVLAERTLDAASIRASETTTLELTTGPGFVMGVLFRVEALQDGPAFEARRAVEVVRR